MSAGRLQELGADPLAFVRIAEERRWHLLELYGLDDANDLTENGKPSPQPDGKRPKGNDWQHKGKLASLGRVKTWRERRKNVGLLPGPSGLAVLDVEPSGLATWARELFPVGVLIVRTPSGGLHVYLNLAAVERVLGCKLTGKLTVPGAELISHGGQVVIPPSRARSRKALDPETGRFDLVRVGEYVVEQMGEPIADEVLLAELLEPFREEASRKIKNGHANAPLAPSNTTTKYGRKLLDAELANIAKATVGMRHPTFIARASRVYAYVAGGEIEEREAEECLRAAWTTIIPDGVRAAELECALRDARAYGFTAPKCSNGRRARATESTPPPASKSEKQAEKPPPDINPQQTEEAAEQKPSKVGGPTEPPPAGALVIAEAQLVSIVDALDRVLSTAHVFSKGPVLVAAVRLEREQKAGPGAVARPAGALLTPPVTPARLVELAMERKSFVRQDLRTETGWRPAALPDKYTRTLIERKGNWRWIHALRGIAEHPIMREDGSIAQASGFDPASGYLIDLGSTKFPEIPDTPTRAQAEQALELFKDLLSEFRYSTPAAFGVHVAAFLTPYACAAIRTRPLFGYSAPAQGIGKTYAAQLPGYLATGREPHITPPPDSPEEFGKLLLAILLEGDAYALIDNIEQPLRSAKLSGAITSGFYRDRVLGVTGTVAIPNACTFAATGVNLCFAGDLARRVVECSLQDRGDEPPDERRFTSSPHEVLLERRPEFVAAALTILRWWHVSRIDLGVAEFASFKAWSRVVREAIVALKDPKVGDPCGTRARIREDDPEIEAISAMLDKLPAVPVTVAMARDYLKEGGLLGNLPTSDEVSGMFRRARDRWVGDRRLVRSKERDTKLNAYTWEVEIRRRTGEPGEVAAPKTPDAGKGRA